LAGESFAMTNLFTDHPNAVGESYAEHLGEATGIGLAMVAGGFACLIHGLLPFLFVKTGTSVILGLSEKCAQRRRLMAAAEAAAHAA
jgi:Family of unknown function (DUF6356)